MPAKSLPSGRPQAGPRVLGMTVNSRRKRGCGLISARPNADGCELDEGKVVGRELVVAGRDALPDVRYRE